MAGEAEVNDHMILRAFSGPGTKWRLSLKEVFYWLVNLTLTPRTCFGVGSPFVTSSLLFLAIPESGKS